LQTVHSGLANIAAFACDPRPAVRPGLAPCRFSICGELVAVAVLLPRARVSCARTRSSRLPLSRAQFSNLEPSRDSGRSPRTSPHSDRQVAVLGARRHVRIATCARWTT